MTALPQIADMPMALDAEAALPEPMVPAEVDLRDFDFMPFYGKRLFESDTWTLCNDAEKVAALRLWWSSWHQEPAGSLPNNDRLLSNLAGKGDVISAFQKVKRNAMNGWILCSDGRWYHPVVADIALGVWRTKRKKEADNAAERERKRRKRGGCPADKAAMSAGHATGIPAENALKEKGILDNKPLLIPLADSQPAGSRKKPVRSWPDGFALDEDLAAYSRKHLPAESPKALFEQFKNHHQAKGSQFADWRAAFRTWVNNAVKFSGKSKS